MNVCKLIRMSPLKLSLANSKFTSRFKFDWQILLFFYFLFIHHIYFHKHCLNFSKTKTLAVVNAYFDRLISSFVVHFLSIYFSFYSYSINFISFSIIYREFSVVISLIVRLSKCDLRLTVVFSSLIRYFSCLIQSLY